MVDIDRIRPDFGKHREFAQKCRSGPGFWTPTSASILGLPVPSPSARPARAPQHRPPLTSRRRWDRLQARSSLSLGEFPHGPDSHPILPLMYKPPGGEPARAPEASSRFLLRRGADEAPRQRMSQTVGRATTPTRPARCGRLPPPPTASLERLRAARRVGGGEMGQGTRRNSSRRAREGGCCATRRPSHQAAHTADLVRSRRGQPA